MANSTITGKSFSEMLNEATSLDMRDKFKGLIYEFTDDVHAMAQIVYFYEEDGNTFLFKDAEFKKPVTDNEFLAMYLDEVVPVTLGNGTSMTRYESLKTETLQFLEYNDTSLTKRFYEVGNHFSGEAYQDLMGFVPGDSKSDSGDSAVVGTAVVGTAVVAPSESSGDTEDQ